MKITATFKAFDRAQWRAWLADNHLSASEIWLLTNSSVNKTPVSPTIAYLDAVEEALCFGWIDGIAKRVNDDETAQRYTPRRNQRSNWTELNKARAKRLITLGLMTPAGLAKLPDLDAPLTVAKDIQQALKTNPSAWQFCKTLPDLYLRIRIGYIEEQRKNASEFERRLNSFISKSAEGKMFGNWNDDGRLL